MQLLARSALVMLAIFLGGGIALTGCSAEEREETANALSRLQQPLTGPSANTAVVGESIGTPAFAVAWASVPDGATLASSDVLRAEIRNQTAAPLRLATFLTVSGLDGRLLTRKLGKVRLAAGERRTVDVEVGNLPLQSEDSDCFVAVEAELEQPGDPVRFSTEELYYRFEPGYARARVWSGESFLAQACSDPGSTGDPMSPRGRLVAATGEHLDASVLANREAVAPSAGAGPQGRTVLTTVSVELPAAGAEASAAASAKERAMALRTPALTSTAEESAVTPTAGAAPLAGYAVMVCSTWRVRFSDAGGTDYLNTSGWFDAKALFSMAQIRSADGGTIHWNGVLSSAACTPGAGVVLPAGSYQLVQFPFTIREGVAFINARRLGDGTYGSTVVVTAFTVSGSATINLRPTLGAYEFNGAAITGQILLRQSNVTGFGVPDGDYTIVTNHAECGVDNDACGGYPVTFIGPTLKPDGTPLIRWRFIVAHEIGHATQDRLDTLIGGNYQGGNDAPNKPLCLCNHVSGLSTAHCLQSREYSTDAQGEGFAHAFATRAFNSTSQTNGTIRYYKEFKNTDGSVTPPPVSKDAYNKARWHELRCTTEARRGVEWDWLTFFFNVSNTSASYATTFDEINEIYRVACDKGILDQCDIMDSPQWNDPPPPEDPDEFTSLQEAAQEVLTSNQFNRFRNTGQEWGVDW